MPNNENSVTMTFRLDYKTGETSDVVVSGTPDWSKTPKEHCRYVGRLFYEAMMADRRKKGVTQL